MKQRLRGDNHDDIAGEVSSAAKDLCIETLVGAGMLALSVCQLRNSTVLVFKVCIVFVGGPLVTSTC